MCKRKDLEEQTARHRKERLGERRRMKCGLWCTIIRYESHCTIDVQFDDGEIVTNKRYSNFIRGSITHPKSSYHESYNELVCSFYFQQLGFEKGKQGSLRNLGFGNKELDLYNPNFYGHRVAIEYDGYAVLSKSHGHTLEKDNLKNQLCKENNIILYRIREPQLPIIENPSSINYILDTCNQESKSLEKAIKEIVNDLQSKISSDIYLDVDFDRDCDELHEFIKENNGGSYYFNRIGEKNMMSCGLEAEIIEYYSSKNITVRFLLDGAIIKNVLYKTFKGGNIKHPKYGCKYRVGETRMQNCGINATVIDCVNCYNYTIQFSTGEIVKNVKYDDFKNGRVKPKTAQKNNSHRNTNFNSHHNDSLKKKERLGQTKMMNCGLEATIIDYPSGSKMTVRFSDGKIVYNVTYQRFSNGNVGHPSIKTKPKITKSKVKSSVGQTNIMHCGMRCTVIVHRNNKDIDVLFDDGTIVQHRHLTDFKRGEIKNPNIKKSEYIEHLKPKSKKTA